MNKSLTCLALAAVLALSARGADVTTTLGEVHLCCQSCVKGVQNAVAKVPGVTANVDRDAGTVTLTGADEATVQKGVDAIVAAGYFGRSTNPAIKVNGDTGAKGEKVQSLKVENVHLCCAKCVKAVNAALEAVPGVKTTTAEKGVKSFTITGDFNDKEALDALQKAGLTGQVTK